MSSSSTRILHLHIPKTAGTALRTAFQTSKGQQFAVFPHYDEKHFSDINPDDYDFFSGHVGFKTAQQIGGRVVTVLRDPIDRFLSVYYFWRSLYEKGIERNRKTGLALKYSIDEFAKIRDEPLLMEEFYNRSTWQLAYGSSLKHRAELHDLGVTDDALLIKARQSVSSFAAVGFQHDLRPFMDRVNNLVGGRLELRRVNVTEERLPLVDLEAKTRQLIGDWVYLDIELYHEAMRISGRVG